MLQICAQKASLRLRSAKTWGILAALLVAQMGPLACKRRSPKPVHVPQMAQGFDASPIDVADLTTHAAARRHVLNMGAPEWGARLGSFALRAQTTITVSQNNNPVSQRQHTTVYVRDADGSSHLQAGNADHQLELIAVGDKAYVRQDKGHLRSKRRQEVDEVEMIEAAASALRQMLQHFTGATLVQGTQATWEGRAALRYEVELSEHPDPTSEPEPSLALLPIAPPSRWREEAKHAHLDGKVVVDEATGVVVKADVVGSMTLTGPTGQPLTLVLRCVHTLTEIGTVSKVREPAESISEIRRPTRPRAPLSFFREAQAPKASGAANPAPAAQAPAEGATDEAAGPPPEEELPEEEGL